MPLPLPLPLASARFCAPSQEGQLDAISIAHPGFSACILIQGAQLVRFCPQGQKDWLWLSECEPFTPGKAVRGGIPICWPWFGDPARNPSQVRAAIHSSQAHGLARQLPWTLETLEESDSQVVLGFALDSASLPAGQWSGRASVHARYCFSAESLRVELETVNTGDDELCLSQALHSYFPTEDIRNTLIDGLDREAYTDALEDWQTRVQHGAVGFKAETDRIYSVSRPLLLTTPTRTLSLQPHNAQQAVVWNPWQTKAANLSHFAPDAWQRMYCVETANVLEGAVCLGAAQKHSMGFTLTNHKPI